MAQEDALHTLLRRRLAELSHGDDPAVMRLVEELRRRHGDNLAAVLLYGSYLRGKRDTLLDFYVLLRDTSSLPRWQARGNRWLPPNVYHLALPAEPVGEPEGEALRAKYATMTLTQFQRAMDRFHSYFWSRFTQPTGLTAADSEQTVERLVNALGHAVHSFVGATVPALAEPFSSAELWCRGLGLTYTCELRSENPAGVTALYEHNADHFDDLLEAYAACPAAAVTRTTDGRYAARAADLLIPAPGGSRAAWAARRVQGKALSVLRLVKAAGTFEDPLDYLLWKIRRHSGVYIEPTERQRRYPLIFAWGLLWRLYRSGGFR